MSDARARSQHSGLLDEHDGLQEQDWWIQCESFRRVPLSDM